MTVTLMAGLLVTNMSAIEALLFHKILTIFAFFTYKYCNMRLTASLRINVLWKTFSIVANCEILEKFIH